MFLSRKISNDTDSRSSAAMSATNDTLVCVVSCDSPSKEEISQQLRAYTRSIQKKIMYEKQEKGEPLTMALKPENYPDYFYSMSVQKTNSFLYSGPSKYEIKITGTLDALKSAVEALVFADYYDAATCSLPSPLEEYAEQLLRGDTPSILTKIAFNF